jgi:hypothetical protein
MSGAELPRLSLSISILRLGGYTNIAAANRHHARDLQRTLKLHEYDFAGPLPPDPAELGTLAGASSVGALVCVPECCHPYAACGQGVSGRSEVGQGDAKPRRLWRT